jgi:hypothetical protein
MQHGVVVRRVLEECGWLTAWCGGCFWGEERLGLGLVGAEMCGVERLVRLGGDAVML